MSNDFEIELDLEAIENDHGGIYDDPSYGHEVAILTDNNYDDDAENYDDHNGNHDHEYNLSDDFSNADFRSEPTVEEAMEADVLEEETNRGYSKAISGASNYIRPPI